MIQQIDQTAHAFLLFASLAELLVSIVLLVPALIIDGFKVRNKNGVNIVWFLVLALLAVPGVIIFLASLYGFFTYLITPVISG